MPWPYWGAEQERWTFTHAQLCGPRQAAFALAGFLRVADSSSAPSSIAAGMIACSVTSVSLRSVCFSSSSVAVSRSTTSCSPRRFGQGDIGSVGGDLVVLDPLHSGDDDQIHYRPPTVLLAD